jgi:hypothetical protein
MLGPRWEWASISFSSLLVSLEPEVAKPEVVFLFVLPSPLLWKFLVTLCDPHRKKLTGTKPCRDKLRFAKGDLLGPGQLALQDTGMSQCL